MPRPPAIIGSRDLVATDSRDPVEQGAIPPMSSWPRDPKLAPDHYDVPQRNPYESVDDYRKRLWAEKDRLRQIDENLQAQQDRLGPYNEAIASELTRLGQAMNSASHAQMCIRNVLDMLPRPAPPPPPPPPVHIRLESWYYKRWPRGFISSSWWGIPLSLFSPCILGPALVIGLGIIAVTSLIMGLNHFTNEHNKAVEAVPTTAETPVAPQSTFSANGSHTLKLTMDSDGRYVTSCRIGSTTFTCMADSGASMGPYVMIAIDRATLRRAGIDTSHIRYTETLTTPSGPMGGAVMQIPSLRVGPFSINNPYVMVSEEAYGPPTLTTGFMAHYNINMRGNVMTITE
jgi:clan AA aspartic protease (TIGR02281 family)